ncbi:NAD-dependent epimerase/dehydratase family protein [Pseudoxanthomonas kalamensis]|uniref:NAD-dependent epimerase/dehydratase family protein n=1 Tax=Pseudoxanthomonas kalamensis TaxID=289483 RepID=UPI0031B6181F
MRRALLFGGSGQIGRSLLARLQAERWQVWAASRQAREALPGVTWLPGDLGAPEAMAYLPAAVDAIFSLGPLDGFAQWYARAGVTAPRVIAFGSTSLQVKQDSADGHERELAARLRQGEATVFATAGSRDAAATLLRPTLVYGAGRDQTLSRIAALAARSGVFVLPRGATGLRQPVHVDDLAAAALAVVDAPASHGQAYALPGGETLAYREMVARTLAALRPPARLLELPAPLFGAAVRVARWSGRLQGLGDAAVARMRQDLVFDAGPAWRDFGYAPRAFAPSAEMLGQ